MVPLDLDCSVMLLRAADLVLLFHRSLFGGYLSKLARHREDDHVPRAGITRTNRELYPMFDIIPRIAIATRILEFPVIVNAGPLGGVHKCGNVSFADSSTANTNDMHHVGPSDSLHVMCPKNRLFGMQSISEVPSYARLAQSAERKALNLVVVGSSPTVGVS